MDTNTLEDRPQSVAAEQQDISIAEVPAVAWPAEAPIREGRLLFRRLIVSLTVIFLTLLGAELGMRWIYLWGQPSLSYSKHFDTKYRLAQTPPLNSTPTVLLLGDSKVNFALYPELLATRLHDKGLPVEVKSLAVHSATPAMSLFLLKTAVASNHKPPLVIFNLEPDFFVKRALVRPAMTDAETQLHQSYFGRCIYKTPTSFDARSTCFIEQHSYLARYRKYLKDTFLKLWEAKWDPEVPIAAKPLEPFISSEISLRGWAPGYNFYVKVPEYQTYFNDLEKKGIPYWADKMPTPQDIQWRTDYLEELMAYCTAQKIPLVMVWLPEGSTRYNFYPSLAYYRERNRLLTQTPGRHVIDLYDMKMDALSYTDPRHVNIRGALVTTDTLANILAQPPYRQMLSVDSKTEKPAEKKKESAF